MQQESRVRVVGEAAVALVLLLVVAPVIVAGAAASAWCYRAWPFFSHARVGLGGRSIRVVKIRSLPPDTDRYADKYSLRTVHVPAAMALLRKLHIDELPPLLLIVRGEMAFVGPRPEMLALHERFAPDFAAERTSVRPGLTGLWQISPHCNQLIGERPEYDRLYIAHRTPLLDLWIIGRTVIKMAGGPLSSLHEVPMRALPSTSPETPEPARITA